MMVVVGRHLRKSQPFIMLAASFSGGFNFIGGIKRAVQDVNFAAGLEQIQDLPQEAPDIGKILDGAGHNHGPEAVGGKGDFIRLAIKKTEIWRFPKDAGSLPEFRQINIQRGR